MSCNHCIYGIKKKYPRYGNEVSKVIGPDRTQAAKYTMIDIGHISFLAGSFGFQLHRADIRHIKSEPKYLLKFTEMLKLFQLRSQRCVSSES